MAAGKTLLCSGLQTTNSSQPRLPNTNSSLTFFPCKRRSIAHNCNPSRSNSSVFRCNPNPNSYPDSSKLNSLVSDFRSRSNQLCFSSNRPISVNAFRKSEAKEVRGSSSNMTITPAVKIADRKLVVKDRTILTGVPENVLATAAAGPVDGVFLGAEFEEPSPRHVTPLGTLRDVKFMACFRFKLWWMAQMMGDSGREIPLETQFLLVECRSRSYHGSDGGDESNRIIYTVFLPLIDGPFRACLQA